MSITQGRLELEGCDITSQRLSCVAIRNGADPRLRRNRIHGSRQGGVFIPHDGLGTLEDNDIVGNDGAGVATDTGGNLTVRRNRINRNLYEAVWVEDGGGGVFENNDLTGNKMGAWDIAAGCKSNVKRSGNRVRGPKAPSKQEAE